MTQHTVAPLISPPSYIVVVFVQVLVAIIVITIIPGRMARIDALESQREVIESKKVRLA